MRNIADITPCFGNTLQVVAQVDLTAFFDCYGFFYVGKFEYNDYGNYAYEMTEEMANACKAAIKAMNLPKPTVDISRLTDKG